MLGSKIKSTALVSCTFIAALLLPLMALPAFASEEEKVTRDFFAMDTVMTLTAYGERAEEAIGKAEEEIRRLEGLLSTGIPESEVAEINGDSIAAMSDAASTTVIQEQLSEDAAYLMQAALTLNRETGGAFDVTVYPLMELWGFSSREYHVPTEEEIAQVLELVGSDGISFDDDSGELTFLEAGMEIDFGGIAKGYTSQRIIDLFREEGISSALVSLGGNVQALGTKPGGEPFRVGIMHPERSDAFLGILSVEDEAVITSGDYERYFEENGNRYHHIIDPATGYPALSGLKSVTIVTGEGTMGDGLSTALFVLGEEGAVEFWKEHGEEFQMVLYTDDGRLLATEGLRDHFTSDYEIQWI